MEIKNTVVLISDEKEKPFANLERIIKGYDKFIKIKDTDTIFITEPSYEGIEKRTAVIMDEIAMLGANAISLSSKKHLLHHASSEDLMLMINLMNPKYYFPVKGEFRNQYANAEIAEELGIPPENIILKQNGDVLELVKQGKLTEGHCKTLLSIEDNDKQYDMALYMIETGSSVRDAEKKMKTRKKTKARLKNLFIFSFLSNKKI